MSATPLFVLVPRHALGASAHAPDHDHDHNHGDQEDDDQEGDDQDDHDDHNYDDHDHDDGHGHEHVHIHAAPGLAAEDFLSHIFSQYIRLGRDTSKDTALMKAILSGSIKEIDACIKTHQDAKTLAEALKAKDASGKNPFCLACSLGDPSIDIIKKLWPFLTTEIVQETDALGRTGFSYAIENEELGHVSYELIESGLFSPTLKDKEGNNALMLAIVRKHKKLVTALLSSLPEQVQSLLKSKNDEGEDALDMALKQGDYETAETLVKLGSDIDSYDVHGETRFMRAVNELSDRVVQFLKQRRANINALNHKRETLFVTLIREERHHLVRYLIEQGVDITIPDATGKSPLDIARSLADSPKSRAIIALLTQAPLPAVLPVDYRKMAMEALHRGDKENYEYACIALGDNFSSEVLEGGMTPLHIAASKGYLGIAEYISDQENVSINTKDAAGNTPMMCAISNGKIALVKYFYQKGTDISVKNSAGLTPENLALHEKQMPIVKYFQEMELLKTLTIPTQGLSRDSFITESAEPKFVPEIATIKGLALILEYYNRKENATGIQESRFYVADTLESLKHAVSLLHWAKDDTAYGILYPVRNHFVAIKCEKIARQNHVVLMDSLGSTLLNPIYFENEGFDNHAEAIEKIILETFSKLGAASHTFFYKNREGRQTSGEVCAIFALKDVRKLLLMPKISTMIQRKHVKATEKSGDMTVLSYRTPAEFMRLVQSYDALQEYQKENKEEAERKVRISKMGQLQNIQEYALTARNKFGIQTPERIQNRNYGKPEHPTAPQYVYKNLSVAYFTRKYIEKIDEYLKLFSEATIRQAILKHDAATLKVDPEGTVMSAMEESLLLQARELQRQKERERQEAEAYRARQLELKIAQEEKMTQEKLQYQYEKFLSFQRSRSSANLVKYGILKEGDCITAEELWDYIYSEANPWNRTSLPTSLLFSTTSLCHFEFDRVSYLKEVAEELRDAKGFGSDRSLSYLITEKAKGIRTEASASVQSLAVPAGASVAGIRTTASASVSSASSVGRTASASLASLGTIAGTGAASTAIPIPTSTTTPVSTTVRASILASATVRATDPLASDAVPAISMPRLMSFAYAIPTLESIKGSVGSDSSSPDSSSSVSSSSESSESVSSPPLVRFASFATVTATTSSNHGTKRTREDTPITSPDPEVTEEQRKTKMQKGT